MNGYFKLSLIAAILMSCAANAASVTIEGCTAFTQDEIQAIAGKATNAPDAAKLLAAAYKKKKYIFINSNVVNKNLIVIKEKTQNGVGKYGKYFTSKSPATLKKIDLAAQRMAAESRANGENVAVNFKQTADEVEISTIEAPKRNFKNNGAAVVFSNYGQKYSGENIGTIYAYAKPGSGQVIEATVSHGFRDSDSDGGNFNSGSITYRKYSWLGETSFRGGITAYSTGGDYRDYDIYGDVGTLGIEHAYLINTNTKVFASINYSDEKKTFGLIDGNDQLANEYFQTGLRGNYPTFTYEASLKQGIASQRSYNLIPLLGNDEPHFAALNVESELVQPLKNNFSFDVKTGAQLKVGSNDTPIFAQAYAGGAGRGRAYNAGFDSAQSAAWGSLTLNTPSAHYQKITISPYFGIDGFYGTKSTNETLNAYSAFIGSKVSSGPVQADIGLARKIGTQSQTGDEYKFVATASLSF